MQAVNQNGLPISWHFHPSFCMFKNPHSFFVNYKRIAFFSTFLLHFHPSFCDIWRNPHSFFVNYKRIAFFFTLLLHFHPSFCDIWRNPYTSFVNSREAHFGHIFFAFYLELSTHYQRNPMNFRRVTFLSLFGSHLPVQVQFSAVSKWLYFGFVFTIELIPGIWACSSYRPT